MIKKVAAIVAEETAPHLLTPADGPTNYEMEL
jgi:hypothetical protein